MLSAIRTETDHQGIGPIYFCIFQVQLGAFGPCCGFLFAFLPFSCCFLSFSEGMGAAMYTSSLFQSPAAFGSVRDSLEELSLHFTYLMRLKSQSLYEHSVRVANFAGATALHMRLPANEVTLIHYAGLLHDIGLLSMPNRILDKYPYFSTRELQLYKKHPDLGANMLESNPACQDLIPYIRFHHERWDGGGYPKHLKTVNIPLGARILALASYYDSNIYANPDFHNKTKSEVTRTIFAGSGTAFDPEVTIAFLQTLYH